MDHGRVRRTATAWICVAIGIACDGGIASAQAPRFEVTVPAAAHAAPLTGRVILVLAKSAEPEPRLLVSPSGPPLFGIDVSALTPGQPAVIDGAATAYPMPLDSVAPGEYWAQVVVNVYEQVKRSDGHTLWLPMNDGRIEFFNTAAGNLYSEPQRVRVGDGGTVRIEASKVMPAAAKPADTEWLKNITIRSEKLTRFWGRPIDIHARVLLPKGYAQNTSVRYPTIYAFGHTIPFSFNPDSSRVRNIGRVNPATGLDTGYDFYRAWTSDDYPRMIAVTLQQQTPYFPDSYSVNSANNGPYGDAIIEEVMPEIDRRFRTIGKPYARIVEGASTNGWQSLALQLKYPDFIGGAWVLQPDPIDFRSYQLTNIYEDANAFSVPAGELTVERPFRRSVEGQVVWTMRQLSAFEDVLGSRGRSGYQLEAWEAVYGPTGDDGYPKPLWDK
jgi:hypothetical protein